MSTVHTAYSVDMQNMLEVLRDQGAVKGMQSIKSAAWRDVERCMKPSLECLPDNDRVCLAILTLFPNKFDVNAAAAVLHIHRTEAMASLMNLQSNAWVASTRQADNTEVQWQLHLLIKGLAASNYQEHPKYLAARQAFVRHFLDMLHAAESEYSKEGVQAMQRFRLQRLNLAEAFSLLALQQSYMQPEDLNKHCHSGLSALRVLTRLLDANKVVPALQKLLEWAEASAVPEDVVGAREQLGYALVSTRQHWSKAERELNTALSARKRMHGPDHCSLVIAWAGLTAVMSAKA